MGWTVYYELCRDRAFDDEERASVEHYAAEAGGGWEVEPFKLLLADAPRSAHGSTKLGDPSSADTSRLFAVLNGLRALVAGAELVVSDDLDAVEWNETWCSYALVGAVRGAIGTEAETQPPVLDVRWSRLWLHVNEGWTDGVYLTLYASGENQGAGTVELRSIGVVLVDGAGVVLHRSDSPAWRTITAKPRAWSYGLCSVPADVWRRTASLEIHGELRRTYVEKLLAVPVPPLSREKSAWDVSALKPAPGRKKLRTSARLSSDHHVGDGRFWLDAAIDAELRMPVGDRLELEVAIVDQRGKELYAFARSVETEGPRVVASVGDYVPQLERGAHVELRARGQSDRAGHLATLRLRRRPPTSSV